MRLSSACSVLSQTEQELACGSLTPDVLYGCVVEPGSRERVFDLAGDAISQLIEKHQESLGLRIPPVARRLALQAPGRYHPHREGSGPRRKPLLPSEAGRQAAKYQLRRPACRRAPSRDDASSASLDPPRCRRPARRSPAWISTGFQYVALRGIQTDEVEIDVKQMHRRRNSWFP